MNDKSISIKPTLWTYWHQGFESAPEIVKYCIASWQKYHPDWKIHLLDQYSVDDYIGGLEISDEVIKKLGLAARSDLIRTKLLVQYGGVWTDPTCFCVMPLEEWLQEFVDNGLFMFNKPGRDRIISSWFIASEEDNHLLGKLYKELSVYWNDHDFRNLENLKKSRTEYWLNRIINRNLTWPRIWFTPIMSQMFKLYPYFFFHYKIYDLIQTDKECSDIYQNMKKFSADVPHKLQRFGLLEPLTDEAKKWVDEQRSPLYKLTWKLDRPEIPKESLLKYLIQSEL